MIAKNVRKNKNSQFTCLRRLDVEMDFICENRISELNN